MDEPPEPFGKQEVLPSQSPWAHFAWEGNEEQEAGPEAYRN